ncbi:hypothetical protein WEU38_12140 [Cyanobacterium aponinum AL20118]|uniref:Uncharacterized protein n=1 Tax=Cyanobacterium aponinum AL20115 TaxID=3090662 RepID=A0AAF1C5P8_9CHRO|nr:hypothetical protein [Cyanobacterium aponinum]WPF87564.1 hypothetical protein SAY89_12195 [Cyanobacterium aponinum AL20115]
MDTAFFKLTPDLVLKISQLNLNQSELKLWMYLSSLEPFGDRRIMLPTSQDMAKRLNMSVASFFRAKAKLQELQLFSFFDKYTEFINNLGYNSHHKLVHQNQSQICDSDSQICDSNSQICEVVSQICDTTNQICDSDSQICENEPLKPLQDKDFDSSQTIKTIKTISYSSDRETLLKERENIDLSFKEDGETYKVCPQVANTAPHCGQDDKVNTESSKTTNLNTQVISQDNSVNNPVSTQATQHNTFSAERSAFENTQSHKKGLVAMSDVIQQSPNTPPNPSKVQIKAWEWLPDGEWKVDHKLDPIFHDWLAKKWMVQYQKSDFFQAKADVLAYFQKTPERLEIRWLQYQEELNARNKHRQQIGITDPTPTNRQSLPSGNQNTVVISDGQRTIKSKDYTGISKQEQIPFNPNLRRRFTEWLNQKTGKTQPKYNNNQTQGLSHI